jgi:hypothetical protein
LNSRVALLLACHCLPSGEFLSLLGFRLGTSSRIQAGLYLETALVGVS